MEIFQCYNPVVECVVGKRMNLVTGFWYSNEKIAGGVTSQENLRGSRPNQNLPPPIFPTFR
jgi:hypothetical protein